MSAVPIFGRADRANCATGSGSGAGLALPARPSRRLSRRLLRPPARREMRSTRLLAIRKATSVIVPVASMVRYRLLKIKVDDLADPERPERFGDCHPDQQLGVV